jgi:hypothetical protein
MGIAVTIDWASELISEWSRLPFIYYADKPQCASALAHYLSTVERAGFSADRERVVSALVDSLQEMTAAQLREGGCPPPLAALNKWLLRRASRA